MMEILSDSKIWLIFSFVIFAGVVWKFGKAKFLAMLDNRIQSIQEEIKVAGNLRLEAQEMLAQYQRKHRDAIKEAEKIIKKAEQQAEALRSAAEAELASSIDYKEKQLAERLERMKQNAKNEIREYAASLAIAATHEIIAGNLKDNSSALIDQSIKNIDKNIH